MPARTSVRSVFFYASSHLFIPLVTGHKKILSFQITEIHFNLIFHLYLYPFKLVDQLSYHFPISVPFPFPHSPMLMLVLLLLWLALVSSSPCPYTHRLYVSSAKIFLAAYIRLFRIRFRLQLLLFLYFSNASLWLAVTFRFTLNIISFAISFSFDLVCCQFGCPFWFSRGNGLLRNFFSFYSLQSKQSHETVLNWITFRSF